MSQLCGTVGFYVLSSSRVGSGRETGHRTHFNNRSILEFQCIQVFVCIRPISMISFFSSVYLKACLCRSKSKNANSCRTSRSRRIRSSRTGIIMAIPLHVHPTTILFFFLFSLTLSAAYQHRREIEIRIGIGIGIGGGSGVGEGGGGGGGCDICQQLPPPPTPPPESPCPPPPPPPLSLEDQFFQRYPKLRPARNAVQQFKAQCVTADPKGVTENWSSFNVCSYNGFFCAAPPDNKSDLVVAALDFNGFNIEAKCIDPLKELNQLAIFHVNSNKLRGTIPVQFATFPYLSELDLSNNGFSGPFPTVLLTGFRSLIFLDLRFNLFAGSVPYSILMPKLDALFLNNAMFTGKIPNSIGSSNASVLNFANNNFYGSIPATIGDASLNLIEVLFLNNKLCGCLPYQIGKLNMATVFDAGGNKLTGPIPASFGCLDKVEQLNFAGNLLYGEIPEAVCALPNLKNLSLSDNYLTWEGPVCRKLAEQGILDDKLNCIPGRPNQRPPWQCLQFEWQPKPCPESPFAYPIPCKLRPEFCPTGAPAPAQNRLN